MKSTRIKICGVTRPIDALAAAMAGADAIGMVFHAKSSRSISLDRAREILAVLPPFVTPVGLFVNATPAEVAEKAAQIGLRHVQLHGHESPEAVADLPHLVVLKAIRASRQTLGMELDVWRRALAGGKLPNLRGLVLETPAAEPGGTGLANDWAFVQECQKRGLFDGLPPLIAAGGLTPATVGEVVRDIQPWAVDVSSGVEASKGVKSKELIGQFIRAVRTADAS